MFVEQLFGDLKKKQHIFRWRCANFNDFKDFVLLWCVIYIEEEDIIYTEGLQIL